LSDSRGAWCHGWSIPSSVEQEAALQDIEAGKGDDDAYVAEVVQRTQETLAKLKAAGDTTRIEDAGETPPHGRQGTSKGRRKGPVIRCELQPC
jgi:hypothetical protein